MQHRIQFTLSDDISCPLFASLSHRLQQIQFECVCIVWRRLEGENLGGYARVCLLLLFDHQYASFFNRFIHSHCSEPLFIFDLGSSVGDVKWAPYSSTVLAAVTSEGKVFVFDINVNKYKPICVQQVVPRKNVKLTRIDFNKKIPFIIAGDDKWVIAVPARNESGLINRGTPNQNRSYSRGQVTSLKLSPNLRLKVKPPKKQQNIDQSILQIQKLDKLLSLVRELPEDKSALIKDADSNVSD